MNRESNHLLDFFSQIPAVERGAALMQIYIPQNGLQLIKLDYQLENQVWSLSLTRQSEFDIERVISKTNYVSKGWF